MAVNVPNLNMAKSAAETTDALARRRIRIGAVP